MCKHEETVTVSNLRYCCKCNKYMGKTPTLDEYYKPFVDKLNEMEQKKC